MFERKKYAFKWRLINEYAYLFQRNHISLEEKLCHLNIGVKISLG
jgi:hypothetical protein